ncbi:MAG: DUF1304 domain-containing protein [Bacteroidales bacterium]|nr:DUF1304 domain-containing protein [Bacteroidales bacterium]
MQILINFIIGIVVAEHLYILWMEMFAWETAGKRVFANALPAAMFKPTKVMAGNQGLYNGFLAAGLGWTFFIRDPVWSMNIAFFFLTCVSIAGIYGAFTASRKIFFVQALPALIGMVMIFISSLL